MVPKFEKQPLILRGSRQRNNENIVPAHIIGKYNFKGFYILTCNSVKNKK